MDGAAAAVAGSIGSVAFCSFLAFAVWIDYRKKKDERDAAHLERMKALELGHPPLDAEIARAKAYASAAVAAGVIGILVPIFVIALAVIGTIVAVLHYESNVNIAVPLIVAWSIASGLALVTIVASLHTIRRIPRPSGDTPARSASRALRGDSSSPEFQEKRLGL
jgi:hypothetical protein